VNDAPSFSGGGDQLVLVDSGPQSDFAGAGGRERAVGHLRRHERQPGPVQRAAPDRAGGDAHLHVGTGRAGRCHGNRARGGRWGHSPGR
jgi:hypothetical protein